MELTLTPEAEAVLEQELRNGRFKDSNDLIATALLAFTNTTPANLENLDAMIDEGIEAAERGEVYTEEEARAYLREMRAKL